MLFFLGNVSGLHLLLHFSSIHPFFLYVLYPDLSHRGLLEPIPAVKGGEVEYTLDRSPA